MANESTSHYEDMSDADLITIIGRDVDPTTSREDLINMAREADKNRLTQY